MKDPTAKAEPPPGHDGARDGEQVPPGRVPAAPRELESDSTTPAGLEPIDRNLAPEAPATAQGDNGSPVVFTPEDVHVRPPDHTPTEAAPESEKAGLIFERS